MSDAFATLLLLACAVFFAVGVTVRFVRRWRRGDRGLRSFAAWLRDLFDVVLGIG